MVGNISKLKSLNGIRGFAILLVLLSHASNVDIFLIEKINFSGAGHYGVFLFFVLSSFLLTRQFLELEKSGGFSLAVIEHYFFRRFLRIYPLFTISMLVYWLLNKIGFLVIPVSGEMILKSLLLFDAEGIFWTVPVEFQFYFILPFISYLLFIQFNSLYAIISGLVFCCIWTYFFPPEFTVNVIPFIPIFIIGSLAAKIYVSMQRKTIEDDSLRSKMDCKMYNFSSFFMMISFILLIPNIYNTMSPYRVDNATFQHQFILFGLLSGGFILTTLFSNGTVRQLMESKFFVFWGKVSFSAYLGHKIILAFVNELGFIPTTVKFLLFFSITALLSHLSYRYFERPLAQIHMIFR